MIKPSVSYPGKTTAPDASYPYGGAKNITTPGDGTGTPWEAALVNDIFGAFQSAVSEAGIVPSGAPETATASQFKEAIRTITNTRTVTHNMASDANYTLTADQNRKRRVVITDTGVLLTGAVDIIVDNVQKDLIVQNDTLQDVTAKTVAGTGIIILAGTFQNLYNDGVNIIDNEHTGIGVGQTWQDVTGSRAINITYTNTSGKSIEVSIPFTTNVGGTTSYLTIDGTNRQRFQHNDNSGSAYFAAIIPNGSTYKLTSTTITVSSWHELR